MDIHIMAAIDFEQNYPLPEDNLRSLADTNSSYEPLMRDLAFIDAFRAGGEAEQSLIQIDSVLYLKGLIGLETGRFASQVSNQELEQWLSGEGGWKPGD